MIGVLACLTVSLTVFALVALADRRWPDRLDRRARHLQGVERVGSNPTRRLPTERDQKRSASWPLVVLPAALAAAWPGLVGFAPGRPR